MGEQPLLSTSAQGIKLDSEVRTSSANRENSLVAKMNGMNVEEYYEDALNGL
jgi:hypothetical protein